MRTRRPITSTTPQPQQQQFTTSSAKVSHFTTPLPLLLSTHATEKKFTLTNQQINKSQQQQPQHSTKQDLKIDTEEDESQPSFMSLNLNQDAQDKQTKLEHEEETDEIDDSSAQDADDSKLHSREFKKPDNLNSQSLDTKEDDSNSAVEQDQSLDSLSTDDQDEQENVASEMEPTENALKFIDNKSSSDNSPEVDERVKQISNKIESIVNSNKEQQQQQQQQQKIAYQHPTQKHFNREEHNEHDVDDDQNRQSFLSLTDLIRTLRPHDKQIIPQIDSDYSNAMRVLGENTGPLIKNNNNNNNNDNEQQRGGGLNFRDM